MIFLTRDPPDISHEDALFLRARSHVITQRTPRLLSPEPYVRLYPKGSEHRIRGIEQFASYVWTNTRIKNSEGLEFGCR